MEQDQATTSDAGQCGTPGGSPRPEHQAFGSPLLRCGHHAAAEHMEIDHLDGCHDPDASSAGPLTDEMRVLVADGQRLFAQALGSALAECRGISVLEEHPPSALGAVMAAVEHRPDAVLLDCFMPAMHGAAAASVLAGSPARSRVLVMARTFAPSDLERCLSAGAAGFVSKTAVVNDVAAVLDEMQVRDGPVATPDLHPSVQAAVAALTQRRARGEDPGELWRRVASLTPREVQVLEVLNWGMSLEDAAETLGITFRTIRNHLSGILGKLDSRSQMEALAFARRVGLIQS